MAEMTAAEEIALLKRQWEHLFALDQDQIEELIQFIQQQAAEIERLKQQIKNMLDPENLPHQWCPVDSCMVVQELKRQNTTFCKDCPQFDEED